MALEIVHVEDSVDDAFFMQRAFEFLNHSTHIRVFDQGANAFRYLSDLASANARIPDLVVLDLQLPDGNGASFLRRLKDCAPHLSNVPVAIVSNHIPLRQQIDQRSVRGCFEKPFSSDQWKQLAEILSHIAAGKTPSLDYSRRAGR